jgi:hypothetical protein
MGGFCDRSLHVEMKNRFCPASAFFCQTPPSGAARPRRAVADYSLAYEINIGVVLVGWPMLLEVI